MERHGSVISVAFGIILAVLFLLSFVIPFVVVPILIAFILVPVVYFGYIRKPQSSDRTP